MVNVKSTAQLLVSALLLGAAACDRSADSATDDVPELQTDSGFIAAEDGVRLFYRTVGDGPLDVVIPVALYLEDALRPLASGDRRLVFYDPRARGRSDAGDRTGVTLDRQVADLEALRTGLGIERMAIVGWSGLAMETAVYAIRHPGRVIRLVQVAPVAARDEPFNAEAYRTRTARTDTAALARLQERHGAGEFANDPALYCRELQRITGPVNFADPRFAAEAPDVCRFPNELPDSLGPLFRSLLASFRGYDWRDAISGVEFPRLVIHGMQDAFPLEGSREWVSAGGDARLLVLEGAGHFPFIERADAFFTAVDTFLRGGWPAEAERVPQ